jgi:hypothetical protein
MKVEGGGGVITVRGNIANLNHPNSPKIMSAASLAQRMIFWEVTSHDSRSFLIYLFDLLYC